MRFRTVLSGIYWYLELQLNHTEYIVTSADIYFGWNNFFIITRKGIVFNSRFFPAMLLKICHLGFDALLLGISS
jgi:hypothetical protein